MRRALLLDVLATPAGAEPPPPKPLAIVDVAVDGGTQALRDRVERVAHPAGTITRIGGES